MPEKSLQERTRLTKRGGHARMAKASDFGAGPVSTHAAKKSRYVVGALNPQDRTSSREREPGKGRVRRSIARQEAATAHPRWPQEKPAQGTRAEATLHKSGSGRTRGSVNGRKKAPSQMKIRRKGGPMKRSRLHGG